RLVSRGFRFAFQPCGAASLLLGSNVIHIFELEIDLLTASHFPAQFACALRVADLYAKHITGAQMRELAFKVTAYSMAVDLQYCSARGQSCLFRCATTSYSHHNRRHAEIVLRLEAGISNGKYAPLEM